MCIFLDTFLGMVNRNNDRKTNTSEGIFVCRGGASVR